MKPWPLLALAAACAPFVQAPRVPAHDAEVRSGLDVLVASDFAALAGERVGLITNHTGIDREGRSIVDLFLATKRCELVALFSPEHGFLGRAEGRVEGERHAAGIAIHSLYGDTRKPTAEMLAGLTCLVFDIQDIGTRFYTYISTMGLCMEAAAEKGLRFVVLDRPNPITGIEVEGPVLDTGMESFVGFHQLPVRHGMTIGEIARLFARERPALRDTELELTVLRMKHWRRELWFDACGLPFVGPSPNMRSLDAALLYPGLGLLETTNVSVGRGTDTPFERLGAPWIDGRRLAARLNRLGLPGIRAYPFAFRPRASKFAGRRCGGVYFLVTDRRRFESLRFGMHLACALRDLWPESWDLARYPRLLGGAAVYRGLVEGAGAEALVTLWTDELGLFLGRRGAVLLYR